MVRHLCLDATPRLARRSESGSGDCVENDGGLVRSLFPLETAVENRRRGHIVRDSVLAHAGYRSRSYSVYRRPARMGHSRSWDWVAGPVTARTRPGIDPKFRPAPDVDPINRERLRKPGGFVWDESSGAFYPHHIGHGLRR